MNLIADLQFAIRRLRRAPGFVAATVVMLALGVGLSVAMFSMLRGVLLSGLPYPDSIGLVSVNANNARQDTEHDALTPAEAVQIAQSAGTPQSPFAKFGYYNWGGMTLFDGQRPRETTIAVVSAGFFSTLGMQPLHGRWFTDDEHEAQKGTVVLSHEEWQRLLGGRPDAIGTIIDSSEGPLQVVGVMPQAFGYPSSQVGAWIPRRPYKSDSPTYRTARYVFTVGRLAPGLNAAALGDRLDALAHSVRESQSLPDEGWQFGATPLLDELVGDIGGTLWGAFAIAMLVLLIACTNAAILFDARQVARSHEQELARALGASNARIWRTALLEVASIGVLGVAMGVLIAWYGLDALRVLAADSVPRAETIALDLGVLAFAAGLSLLTPLIVAAAGSLRRRDLGAQALRAGGRGLLGRGSRARRLLPTFAIALSTVSLVTACALGLSLMRLKDVAPGFRADEVRAMALYKEGSPDTWLGFAEQMRARLTALPGVSAVALTSAAPMSGNGSFAIDVQVGGHAQPEPYRAGLRRVSAGYLPLLEVPLLAGRNIADSDRAGTEPVAVINRELARRSFGDASALGQTLSLPLGQGDRTGQGANVSFRVVGVMENIRNDGLRAPAAPEILVPYAQSPWAGMTFTVRMQGTLAGIDQQMAEQVWALAPRQAIQRQFALTDQIDAQLSTVRFFAYAVGAFALSALLLGAFGVYAVATLQQRQRVREFGLRLAVGARPAVLASQVLREGSRMVATGALFGVAGAWLALRLIADQTFGLESMLIAVTLAGVATMSAAALLALMLPALRAARTDPMTALRYE